MNFLFLFLSKEKQEGKVESVFFVAIGHSEVRASRSSASSSPAKQRMS